MQILYCAVPEHTGSCVVLRDILPLPYRSLDVVADFTQAASPQSMSRRGFASRMLNVDACSRLSHYGAGLFAFLTLMSFAPLVVPEHTKLKMPALSPTMTQGNIASWTKKVGDKVKPGETMAEVSMLDHPVWSVILAFVQLLYFVRP